MAAITGLLVLIDALVSAAVLESAVFDAVTATSPDLKSFQRVLHHPLWPHRRFGVCK